MKKFLMLFAAIAIIAMPSSCKKDSETTSVTVTLNANGGTINGKEKIDTTLESGAVLTPPTPVRNGYSFVTWCTDKEGTTSVDVTKPVTQNVTWYAKWKEDVQYRVKKLSVKRETAQVYEKGKDPTYELTFGYEYSYNYGEDGSLSQIDGKYTYWNEETSDTSLIFQKDSQKSNVLNVKNEDGAILFTLTLENGRCGKIEGSYDRYQMNYDDNGYLKSAGNLSKKSDFVSALEFIGSGEYYSGWTGCISNVYDTTSIYAVTPSEMQDPVGIINCFNPTAFSMLELRGYDGAFAICGVLYSSLFEESSKTLPESITVDSDVFNVLVSVDSKNGTATVSALAVDEVDEEESYSYSCYYDKYTFTYTF